MLNGSNTIALVSVPRLGFNEAWGAVYNALAPHSISARQFTGAYWDQGLEACLDHAIDQGHELAITLDYDSLFTATDISRLLAMMEYHEEYDALAGLQPKRDTTDALFAFANSDTATVTLTDYKPFRVDSAHFGLTAIRLSALQDVPRPWFEGKTGSAGTWRDDDKLDPDMSFWSAWKRAGKTIYVSPEIRVGHLVMMVSVFGPDCKHQHISVKDWKQRSHLPTQALNRASEEAVA